MGKTRRRVTFLVLSLESIGLLMLALSVYLAGSLRLSCERSAVPQGSAVVCEATEKRFLGLVTLQHRRYEGVIGARMEPPALGRSDYWLSLETTSGASRILPGSRERAVADVRRVEDWLGEREPEALVLKRSTAPLAVGAAVFGCVWIFVISLIMREFLGYHTPWWWLGKKA